MKQDQITNEITDALSLFHPTGDVFEVRIPHAPNGRDWTVTKRGYFDNPAKAAQAIMPYYGKATIYHTFNKLPQDYLARSNNRLSTSRQNNASTRDADITDLSYLLIDIDPVRKPKDVSATDEELKLALAKRNKVEVYLKELGWEAAVVGMSGNGGHLYYNIDLPNEEAFTNLIKEFLNELGDNFDDVAAKIDRTVFNASRITKVFGTVSCKGDHVDFRPWRKSVVEKNNPDADIVTAEDIERAIEVLGGGKPTQAEQQTQSKRSQPFKGYTEEGIDNALGQLGVGYKRKDKGGRAIFALDKCLTSSEHVDGACITLEGAKAGYKCHHNTCAGKTWGDIKGKLFPDDVNAKNGGGAFDAREVQKILYQSRFLPIRLNELTGEIFVDSKRLDDITRAQMVVDVRQQARISEGDIVNTVRATAATNRFHPMKDYFESLTWDGRERLTELIAALSLMDPMEEVFFRAFLIGTIAKVYERRQNFALVIDGKQGIGKSTLIERLCPHVDWYQTGPFNPNNKDDKIRMHTTLLWELSELQQIMRHNDRELLKWALTAPVVDVRPPYGRHSVKRPVTASFIGTINDTGTGFLNDPTGNRRFVVIKSVVPRGGTFGAAVMETDIDQLWAENFHNYREFGAIELSPKMREWRDGRNREYEAGSHVAELFDLYFVFDEHRNYAERNIDPHNGVWATANIIDVLQKHVGLRGSQPGNRALLIEHLKGMGVTEYENPTRTPGNPQKTKRGWKHVWARHELREMIIKDQGY